MDFDNSHNYMLEKDAYSQQDIDYAFQLRKKERKGAVSAMLDNYVSASGIYMSLIMEKIFGVMKNRFLKNEEEGGIDEKDVTNSQKMKEWLDNDMGQCLAGKEDEMEMVIRGIKRSMDDPDKQAVIDRLYDVIEQTWLGRLFAEKAPEQKLKNGYFTIQGAFARVMSDDDSPFYSKIQKLVDKVLKEKPPQENDLINQA